MLRKQRRYPLLHRLAVYRWNKGTQIPFVPAFSGRTVWPQRLVPRALMHLVNSDCLLKFRVLLVFFSKGNVPRSHVYNASQKRNPVHSITLYWPDFQSHNAHWNLMIFKKKTLSKYCSSWLHASFDTFWVQIEGLRYEHGSFKCLKKSSFWPFSKQNVVSSIFC